MPHLSPRLVLINLALLVAACHPSQEEYDAQVRRADDLEAELAQSNEARAELDARIEALTDNNRTMAERLAALGENVEQLRSTNEGLNSDLTSTRGDLETTRRALEELQERERQNQERLNTFRELMGRFRSMIDSGRLRVRIVRNRMVVELPNGILFDSGRAELKEGGVATIDEVAAVLRDIPNREFQVAGHTDNVPMTSRRFRDNWHLSTARALTVNAELIRAGVPENRISAAGYADTQPVASNDDPEGRQQNRRIEIVLLPNLDELPDLSQLGGE